MKKLRITVDGKVFEVVVESLDEQGNPVAGQPAAPAFQQTSIAPPPSSAPKPAAAAAPADSGPDPLHAALAAIDPDALSPREALDALYRLKDAAGRRD